MESTKVISQNNPKSPVAEAFRILRTNLHFSSVDKPFKSLLITSAEPGEGKSTTTANLGTVMAQTGAKVLIIDCDLRRAEQHNIFGVSNDIGLTHLIAGDAEVSQVIKNTKVPNLQIITSGPLPPNPAEMLGSQRMKEVMDKLSEIADIILLDSPPTVTVADGAILSTMVDGVVLVIKSAKTKIEAVKTAKDRLEKANARIVGTVLNATTSSSGGYYYSDYSYYGESKSEAAATKN